MNLNVKLKEARKKVGLTQEDVEKKSGINKKTISNWENGVSRPDVDSVSILCRIYGISPNAVFEWNESPDEIHTIAAHHDGETWTDEELDEIEQFKKYVLSKRK